MKHYVYLTSWYMDGNSVENPILDEGEKITADVPTNYYYPDADMDGKPDGSSVMAITESMDGKDYFGHLDGVIVLPCYDLNTKIADIPQEVVTAVIGTLVGLGIPADKWSGTKTAGELLDKIMAHYSPSSKPITQLYTGREHEFA